MPPNKSNSQEIVIKKSNELIEARYRLSIEEQRLILLLASFIHQDDEDFKDYEIRVSDFVQMFGLEKRKAIYKAVEEASKELAGKKIDLSRDGKKIYASWLSYVEYVEGSGVVKLRFDKSLKPYLLQLKNTINITDGKKGFTQYQLRAVMNFKSSYSIRLYELLKMEVWKAKKSRKKDFEKYFTLEEYRQLLGIDKKAYPLFSAFRTWTIEPPVKEITEQTDLEIFETRYIKTGRKITGICFIVIIRSEEETKARQESLTIDDIKPEKPESHPIIDSLINMGLSYDDARILKNKYPIRQIERNIAYVQAEINNKKTINSVPGYLNSAIKADWGKAPEDKKTLLEKKKQEEAIEKARKEKEDEKKVSAQKALKKKTIEAFFNLPEGLKKHIQTEYRAILENKNHGNDVLFWDNTIESQERLFTSHIAWDFANFLIEKNYVN